MEVARMPSEHADVSDEFIEALVDYQRGRSPTVGDVEAFESWLGQEPDHNDELAIAAALLGQYVVCPFEAIPAGDQPSVADADDEWLLVDERALVGVEDHR
jgi:hypothetical protein